MKCLYWSPRYTVLECSFVNMLNELDFKLRLAKSLCWTRFETHSVLQWRHSPSVSLGKWGLKGSHIPGQWGDRQRLINSLGMSSHSVGFGLMVSQLMRKHFSFVPCWGKIAPEAKLTYFWKPEIIMFQKLYIQTSPHCQVTDAIMGKMSSSPLVPAVRGAGPCKGVGKVRDNI